MAVAHSTNPHRLRNVFLVGIVVGAIGTLMLGSLRPGSEVTKRDVQKIDDRLAAIEKKLSPSPSPISVASPGPDGLTIAQINKEKDPKIFVDRTVELSGKVSSVHSGVGFILVDTDGTFIWVHYKGKIPSNTATAKGKIVELKDQIAQWKNEPGWPDNDSALTAKLREEKIFLEAENVT